MKQTHDNKRIQGLMVLLVFAVFSGLVLWVLLMGAQTYDRLAQRDGGSYDRRTASQYLTTRVRQADRLDGVTAETFEGVEALVVTEEIEGETYQTLVYCYDGWLRELFTYAGSGLLPEDGEKVLPAQALSVRKDGRRLHFELTDSDGDVRELMLYLRSGEGDEP